jgi:hypothetical protein
MSDKLAVMVREEAQASGPDHRQRLLEPMRVERLAEPGIASHLRRDGGAGHRQEERGGGPDGPGRTAHGLLGSMTPGYIPLPADPYQAALR